MDILLDSWDRFHNDLLILQWHGRYLYVACSVHTHMDGRDIHFASDHSFLFASLSVHILCTSLQYRETFILLVNIHFFLPHLMSTTLATLSHSQTGGCPDFPVFLSIDTHLDGFYSRLPTPLFPVHDLC